MNIATDGLGRLSILCAVLAGALLAPVAADAATVYRDGGALHVQEDGLNGSDPKTEQNRIEITFDAGEFVITDLVPLQPVLPCHSGTAPLQTTASTTVRCPSDAVDSIEVGLGDLADLLFLSSGTLSAEVSSSTVTGGTGVDEVQGLVGGSDEISGDEDDDILFGNGGNDTLRGKQGFDTLHGGGGGDTLQGGAGEDDFSGGSGTDTVDYSADGASGVGAAISDTGESGSGCFGAGSGTCERDIIRSDVENLKGTTGADRLFGSDADNTLAGLAGDDLLVGRGGNDSLQGDEGDDRLRGGLGNDNLQGGAGTQDVVDYTERVDPSDPRSDVSVDLGAGTATAPGVPAEADSISNAESAETGAGDDTLIGTDSTTDGNRLHGGDGADLLRGKDGADQLIGGGGVDTVSYVDDRDDDSRVTLTLDDQQANDGSSDDGTTTKDTVTEIENAIGGPDDDDLTGSSANNELSGAGGDDTLQGLGGADKFYGGLVGADSGGNDTVEYDETTRTAGVTADLDGQPDDGSPGEGDLIDTSIENVTGSVHGDTLTGSAGANVLSGSDGDDLLRGGLGGDAFNGGSGEDTVDYSADGRNAGVTVTIGNSAADDGDPANPLGGERDDVRSDVENVIGTTGADNLGGNSDANKLLGLGGADTVNGFGGDDTLDGGAGSDTVNGSAGNDTLHGGSNGTLSDGADVIDGGTGADTVTYSRAAEGVPFTGLASATRSEAVRISLDGVANDGQVSPAENDSVSAVEHATGGDGNDQILGTTGAAGVAANRLDGRGGDDMLNPGAEGGTPVSDELVGGAGRDRADYSTRGADDLAITLDGQKNDGKVVDGEQVENDHISPDVEDVTTADGADDVAGSPASVNDIRTNGGNDTIRTRDANADTVDCGAGTDTLIGDRRDVHVGCENPQLPPAPLVSVAGPQDAVSEGAGDATFTISIDDVVAQDVTVQYATSDGTATSGQDYEATSGTATIPAGSSSVEVDVPVTQDQRDEDDETLTLKISSPANATIAPGGDTASATISDDDASPAMSVEGGEVTEGDDGSKELTFTVTQSEASGRDVRVEYATGDGTAKAGEDYTATSGTLTIPEGETTAEVKVPVLGDTAVEADEALTLTLSDAENAGIADGKDSATGTIRNDDESAPQPAVPAISVNDIKVAEGDAGTTPAVFTVSLSVPTTATVTVKYVTSDGTATSGSDYALTAGTLAFAPGERSKTVSVPVTGDRRDEPDETFALVLVEPRGGTLFKSAGGALITDDESPRVAPKVSFKTTPTRDRTLPYRFRTRGTVQPPAGVRKADACAGKVQVRFKAGRKTVSARRVKLGKDCTFSRSVTFGIKSRLRPGRLKVDVRFLGNAVLLPKSAAIRHVRVR